MKLSSKNAVNMYVYLERSITETQFRKAFKSAPRCTAVLLSCLLLARSCSAVDRSGDLNKLQGLVGHVTLNPKTIETLKTRYARLSEIIENDLDEYMVSAFGGGRCIDMEKINDEFPDIRIAKCIGASNIVTDDGATNGEDIFMKLPRGTKQSPSLLDNILDEIDPELSSKYTAVSGQIILKRWDAGIQPKFYHAWHHDNWYRPTYATTKKVIIVYIDLINHSGGTALSLPNGSCWDTDVETGEGIIFDNHELFHAGPLMRLKSKQCKTRRTFLHITLGVEGATPVEPTQRESAMKLGVLEFKDGESGLTTDLVLKDSVPNRGFLETLYRTLTFYKGELDFEVINVDGAVEVEDDESKDSQVCSVESGWRVTKVNGHNITKAEEFYTQLANARMAWRMTHRFELKIEFNMNPAAVSEAEAYLRPEGEMEPLVS